MKKMEKTLKMCRKFKIIYHKILDLFTIVVQKNFRDARHTPKMIFYLIITWISGQLTTKKYIWSHLEMVVLFAKMK